MDVTYFHLKWTQGKCEDRVHFLSENEIAFTCGSNIKICRTDYFSETCIEGPVGGIQCLATNHKKKLLAFSDKASNNYIYIVDYLTFQIISQFNNDGFYDYLRIEFASSTYLFTLEDSPLFTLTLWNWESGVRIQSISHELPYMDTTGCIFSVHSHLKNMACFLQVDRIHFYDIDDLTEVRLRKHTIYLPQSMDKEGFTTLNSTEVENLTWFDKLNHESWGIHSDILHSIPLTCCCEDMSEVEIVRLFDYLQKTTRSHCACHCWLQDSDLLLSTMDGSVLYINFSQNKVKVLYYSEITENKLHSCTITCMSININGLYAAKYNGDFIFVPDFLEKWNETKMFSLSQYPLYTKFLPDFTDLVIITEKNEILVYSLLNNKLTCLSFGNVEDSVVGVYVPNELYVITAKTNGKIEAWEIKNGIQQSETNIGDIVTTMEGSTLLPLALIATSSSYLYIVDASESGMLRTLEILRPCEKPIIHICIQNYGKLALLLSEDNKLFVLSILPTKNFCLLGYTILIYQIKDMALFSNGLEDVSYIFLLCWPKQGIVKNSTILTFELPNDFEDNFNYYWKDESGILDFDVLELKEIIIDHIALNIIVHQQLGVFLAVIPDNDIQNMPEILDYIFPDNISRSLSVPFDLANSRLIISPSNNAILIVNCKGEMCLWLVNDSKTNYILDISTYSKSTEVPFIKFAATEDALIIGSQNGDVACYDLSILTKRNVSDWIIKRESTVSLERKQLFSRDSKIVRDAEMIPWDVLMIGKQNEKCLKKLEVKRISVYQRMFLLAEELETLTNENSLLPEEYQWGNEEFILEDKPREDLINEKENSITCYEKYLSDQLNDGLKIISDMKQQCIDNMLQTGNILDSLSKGRSLYNYPIVNIPEYTKSQIQKAFKKSQIEKCLKDLMLGKEYIEREESLNFDLLEFKEIKEKIGTELRKEIFLLQTKEERIDYTYILEYIIFQKRLAFNRNFQQLLEFKKETVNIIKANNLQIKETAKLIGEEHDIWELDEVTECLEIKLHPTEEEIEKNSHLKLEEESKISKGIAGYFLEDKWLQALLSPTDAEAQQKLKKMKRDALSRMKKEIDKLHKNSLETFQYYETYHERIVDEKLKWDLDILQEELQLFLIIFCTSNRKQMKRGYVFLRNCINNLKVSLKMAESQKTDINALISKMKKVQESLNKEAKLTDFEVMNLSKLSRNKYAYLEAYTKRPRIKSIEETLDPNEVSFKPEYSDFQEINSIKYKPPRVPLNFWRELCLFREQKVKIEGMLDQVIIDHNKFSRSKEDINNLLDKLRASILVKSVFSRCMHEKVLDSFIEVPIVFSGNSSQLETEFPNKLAFNFCTFIKKRHIEALNNAMRIAGEDNLQALQKKEKAKNQIKRNVLKLKCITLEQRDLKIDIETILSLPLGREVQNAIQDPKGFGPHIKINELEKSHEQEKSEIQRHMQNSLDNISREKARMENLRRGMNQRLKEIEKLKGNLHELFKLGDKK
ncbi:cilia-and flagella-associated protein 43 [Trichonephila clavata]|uniref:Cilia- and flagella-associated protein 43 n=1 Tax=Trichonephila clavata TaxID=2740835 RepID=A0A8X6G723_TRICU|nr:cilia-and flagella-associated protein 43 [Trichonephila clavata]